MPLNSHIFIYRYAYVYGSFHVCSIRFLIMLFFSPRWSGFAPRRSISTSRSISTARQGASLEADREMGKVEEGLGSSI